MGLITNQSRNGFSPWRWRNGALVSIQNGGHALRNGYLAGWIHNWNFHLDRQVALPQGNLAPDSWMLPRTGGGMSMRVFAAGSMSANLIPTYPMLIDLTGSGDLNATAALIVSMLAAFSGSGDMTASIIGQLNASCDMTGSGDLEADMVAVANALVSMIGTGDLEATIAAFGDMTIDMVVTGTGLSTANVGQAVWAALASLNNVPGTMGEKLNDAGSASNPWTEIIEGPFTAADMLKIISAFAAGKTTIVNLGGGQATVTFRNVTDTKDAIDADMTNSERTNVTLNP